jgi:serine/threonine protein kinase
LPEVGLVDSLQVGDPSQIGPFRLVGRLGDGGMGRVFLGQSPGGRKVAIKVVHPHYASDPEFRRRFAREVTAARQVGGFHTAAVVGADPEADPPWMATAYIPGPSLAQAVAQRGPLDEAGVLQLGAALAEGLAAIHDCGLIHRDLKPSNVIMADDGPRIIDFGIARSADVTALTGSGVVIGTLRYMSPEQLQGQEVTPQSDVFALGTLLAYAATGHDPFAAPTVPAVITRILTGPPDLAPLGDGLRAVIVGCLAKDPGDRPSPADLLARFSDHGTHDATAIAAPAPVPAVGPAPEAVLSPLPRSAEMGGSVRRVPEMSPESTVTVSAAHEVMTPPPVANRTATSRGRLPRTALAWAAGLIAAVIIAVVIQANVGGGSPGGASASAGPSASESLTPSGTPSASATAGQSRAVSTPSHKETLLAQGAVARGPAGDATAQSNSKDPADLAGFSWTLQGASLRFTISYYNVFNPDLDATIYLRTTPGPAGADCPGLAGAQYGIVVDDDGYGVITRVSTTCPQQSTIGTASVSKTDHGWVISVPATSVGLGSGGLTQVRVLGYTQVSSDSTTGIEDYLPDVNDSPLLIDVPKSSA